MRNRIKRFNRDADTEKLLKEAKRSINKIFMGFDLSEIERKVLSASWEIDLQTIMLCERKGSEELLTDKDVDELIKILNTVNKILKDPEAPEETKALLVEMYCKTLLKYTLCKDKYRTKKLFERRAEIEKDNPLRSLFIVNYIEDEVYPRFYETRDKELEAKGIDLDEYDENLTKEELEKASKEWQEHTNELFREYGESHLIGWVDLKIIKKWQEKLPKDIKMEMAERERQLEIEGDIICKIEELKDEKGITDEEAVKLLTDEEREILRKGGLLDEETTP